ncbi:MAG: hypothetical protein Q8Q12_18410 [bacterium]|nr:hypothetical protein [bacterium]
MEITSHEDFVRAAAAGHILIGIEPALARRFFTNIDRRTLEQKVGAPLTVQRLLVKTAWLLEWISLLAGMIASVVALGWYAAIAVPVMAVASFILGGMASYGRQRMRGAICLVLLAVSLAYALRHEGPALVVWLALLPLPYFFARLTYKLGTALLRRLCLKSERVFNLLSGRAIFFKENDLRRRCE